MEFKRAQEILNSPETIDVTFQGNPIWIEELLTDKKMALVSSNIFEDGKAVVPVEQLQEG